jgi:hypothetical protein
LSSDGSEIMGSSPDDYATFISADIKKWGAVVRAAKVTVN